jgi:DnaJ-class molecular chaperone
MEIMCFVCNGSGWKNHYPFGLNVIKPIEIYIPCPECRGKGFISLSDKASGEEKIDGKN